MDPAMLVANNMKIFLTKKAVIIPIKRKIKPILIRSLFANLLAISQFAGDFLDSGVR